MAVTASKYHTIGYYIGASVAGVVQINLDADTFKLQHCSSFTFNNDHSAEAQITGELNPATSGFGNYTTGGITLANVTWTVASSGTCTFDADDVIVTASGGDFSAAAGALYRDGATDPLMIHYDYGGTQTAGDTTVFKITWAADGIMQMV